MATIRVSANELRVRAEQLHSENASLSSKIEEFEAAAQALAAQWEGEARDAFVNACNMDKEQMDNFSAVIEAFYQALLEIAKKYEEAEDANLNIATSRSYA